MAVAVEDAFASFAAAAQEVVRRQAVIGIVLCLVIGYTSWTLVYNLWLSPLSKVPGPPLFAISELPLLALTVASRYPHKKMLALHRQYGDVVRTGPRSVSCLHAGAWQEVYGYAKPGQAENVHLPGFFDEARHGVIAADTAGHAHQRRILSPAFSAHGMRSQEPMIQGYVDLLFRQLREQAARGAVVDMSRWFNYTTFDIIGDLAFGESFGMLERSGYHSWIANLMGFFHTQYVIANFRRAYPRLEAVLTPVLKLSAAQAISAHNAFVDDRVRQRLALPSSRPDFVDAMMSKDANGVPKLPFEAIRDNASILLVGGSETTATALSGITYFLCVHPDIQAKLADEVDVSFARADDITLLNVQHLAFLTAVINETLRIYPATASSAPRIIRAGGQVVGGYFLPANTIVDIWHWTMYHNPKHFREPDAFIPARFMGDARFDSDNREAFAPFSTGKRGCIGPNLAFAEMRLIIARLLWNYQLELAEPEPPGHRWHDHVLCGLWAKPPLFVRLKARAGRQG